MRSILAIFALLLAFTLATSSPASAEEPAATPSATGTPVRNKPGWLRRQGVNQEAVVLGFGPDGCPNARTNGAQHMRAEEVETFMDAATDARVRCVRAHAEAQATTTLAQAGATVATTAAQRGQEVYVTTDGRVATGQAASYAAMQGTFGVPMGVWPNQAAADMAALQAVNSGGFLPPPPAPQTRRPPPPPSGPTPAEVAAAEARARKAAGR